MPETPTINPPKTLVVVVPGFGSTVAQWKSLLDRLQSEPELANSTVLPLDHNLKRWSTGSLKKIAGDLSSRIDPYIDRNGGFDQILIFGHSLGGLLVREMYLQGMKHQAWTGKVVRIALFAGMSRGYVTGRAGGRLADWGYRILPPFSAFQYLFFRRQYLVSEIRAGSEFVTSLRLRWMRDFCKAPNQPPVVQILGKDDGLVEPMDSLDTEQFPNAWHVPLEQAAHWEVIKIPEGELGEDRYYHIRKAVLGPVPPSASQVREGAKDVFFLLHGIQSHADFWMLPLKKVVEDMAPGALVQRSSYGDFTALSFAWPRSRVKNMRWFLDTYSSLVADNPGADFHFVGHSYGTYLFGRALQRNPDIRFNRVCLAGSVLPRTFNWNELHDRNQVQQVKNVRATKDTPVALLCSGLAPVERHDIGTAGFKGFLDICPGMEEFLIEGGHSAAIDSEADLKLLAEFIVNGRADFKSEAQTPPRWIKIFSNASPYLLVPLAFALIAGAVYFASRGQWIAFTACLAPFALLFIGTELFK